MTNSTVVEVFDTGDDLLKEAACFFFFEPFAFDDVLKEFTARSKFHDQKQLS